MQRKPGRRVCFPAQPQPQLAGSSPNNQNDSLLVALQTSVPLQLPTHWLRMTLLIRSEQRTSGLKATSRLTAAVLKPSAVPRRLRIVSATCQLV